MDKSHLLDRLGATGDDRLLLVFRILPKGLAAEVFAYLDSDQQAKIVDSINDAELSYLVEEL